VEALYDPAAVDIMDIDDAGVFAPDKLAHLRRELVILLEKLRRNAPDPVRPALPLTLASTDFITQKIHVMPSFDQVLSDEFHIELGPAFASAVLIHVKDFHSPSALVVVPVEKLVFT